MSAQFITTEPFKQAGEQGEKQVWQAVQTAFANRPSLAYWRYPIFSQTGQFRKEPDILILDQELGLIIIEVKAIKINKITSISGHQWQYNHYYTLSGNPYQQAESQLFALLNYTEKEPSLKEKITARVVICLPYITQADWAKRGFEQLPTNPPIVFKNDLTQIYSKILKIPKLKQGEPLNHEKWNLLLSILSGKPLTPKKYRVLSPRQSRGKIIEQLNKYRFSLDIKQERIAKQIPPGCQRIRGIAGSGKTVILCQRAAHLHLKYPDWRIALVFFSRNLYYPIIQQLDHWLRYFSQNNAHYNIKNRKLQVLHAWGSKDQKGFYRLLCQQSGVESLGVQQIQSKKPNEALAEACYFLLQQTAIPQLFDVILIDEGQDLIVDQPKYQNKQPFYWLAYQALHPVDPASPEQKRLIWAYDEGQSLDSFQMPSGSEILGEELGHLVTGEYREGIQKTEVLSKCYRTPHLILTLAHAISMGWLRKGGLLTGMSHKTEWQALGYEVEGELKPYETVTVYRPLENSLNPLPKLWSGSYIEFEVYSSRQREISALAKNILQNLREDGLRPNQILVIIVGWFYDAAQLETYIANFLIKQGIDIYIPTAHNVNVLKVDKNNRKPNQFFWEGAVTISRIHRSKGQEADLVYVVGLDGVAQEEDNLILRNQLLVAFTRSRGWLNISGVGTYSLYAELREVLHKRDRFTFTFPPHFPREISVTDAGELLQRYAKGRRNFRKANLAKSQLQGLSLKNINLIGANLREANLQNTDLEGAKLIAADLTNAVLKGANLRKAKLMGANLQGVDLQGVNLSLADLTDVQLGIREVD